MKCPNTANTQSKKIQVLNLKTTFTMQVVVKCRSLKEKNITYTYIFFLPGLTVHSSETFYDVFIPTCMKHSY